MKSFFRKVDGFLKYVAALIAGGLYIWAIIFLLNDDNWIGISTLTTMLLAIAAFWVIWQNYSFRKEDRKSKALDGIRNWANGGLTLVTRIWRLPTTHAKFPPVFEVIAQLSYMESQRHTLLRHAKFLNSKDLENTLNKALNAVKNCLESYKGAGDTNRLDSARKCDGAFVEVLNEAAKIKTKDVT